MCILRILSENTPEKIGQERAGTEWTVVKSKIRLCIRKYSYEHFLHGGILMGIALPIPSHGAKFIILRIGSLPQQTTAGVQMHCRENQTFDFGKEAQCHDLGKK